MVSESQDKAALPLLFLVSLVVNEERTSFVFGLYAFEIQPDNCQLLYYWFCIV